MKKIIEPPPMPKGANLKWWHVETDDDGFMELDQDAVWITMDNGYWIDITGCWPTTLAYVRVGGGTTREWDKFWEDIECETVEEIYDTVVRLVNKWVKRDPVDPKVEEGVEAERNWGGPTESIKRECEERFKRKHPGEIYEAPTNLVYIGGMLRRVKTEYELKHEFLEAMNLLDKMKDLCVSNGDDENAIEIDKFLTRVYSKHKIDKDK